MQNMRKSVRERIETFIRGYDAIVMSKKNGSRNRFSIDIAH